MILSFQSYVCNTGSSIFLVGDPEHKDLSIFDIHITLIIVISMLSLIAIHYFAVCIGVYCCKVERNPNVYSKKVNIDDETDETDLEFNLENQPFNDK